MNVSYLSITQAHELLKSKQVTATQLTQYYLDRIATHDAKIRACLTVCSESALAQAAAIDAKIAQGDSIGLLEGIPYTAKDMFLTRGIRTTAASHMLNTFEAPYSATAIQKLEAAGAILLAKVNHDEYAHGGSTEQSAYHPTHNPWDLDRVPGGSSGGSAAAVAADFGIFSMGTDTGGSIRQPASYCGVTGYKPTYGAVSRYGVVAMASSFDVVGPLTRTAEDAALIFEIIAGVDSMDATTVALDSTIELRLENITIGTSRGAEQAVVQECKNQLADLQYQEVDLPNEDQALAAYYVLVPSEISSNLERYDSIRYGSVAADTESLEQRYARSRGEFFGPEVKRRNLIGAYALSAGYYDAYYNKAMQVRTSIRAAFDKLFEQVDLLVLPTTLAPAFCFGEKSDPVEMYKTDSLTVSANLAGLPAISIPAGRDQATGLPMGLQIIGKQQDDAKVLAAAHAFQQATDWHTQRPPL